ncbi:MAG: DUF6171 family protein [Lachnospiraceae bacterium]
MDSRFCRKCLMRDMAENDYFVNLRDYIDAVDRELKTEADEYERRLGICRECDSLISGMCIKCGCYVELRAVMKKGYCPDADRKW